MLEYDRINASEGINVIKANESNKCDICHYWYFLEKRFKFESNLCNGCGYLMQKAMDLTDVPIVSIKGIIYRINFWLMSKDDAINLMKNSD